MTERWWDDEEEKTTKQTVEDLMNEAEIKRIQREEELKEAEHRKKMAKLTDSETGTSQVSGSEDGMLITNPDEEMDGGKVFESSTRVGGSDHWLLEDPGYTVVAVILGLGLIATSVMAVASGGTKDQWAETRAEVLEKYPGYDWVEYEDCYTDDWGEEYCEYWYELDCWTDLDVSYSVDNTTYSSEVDHFPITTYQDYEGAEDDCFDYVENGTIPIGSFVILYYNTEDPGDVRLDPPWDDILGLFLCGIIQLILLIVVLIIAYLDVGGNSVSLSSDGGRYYDDPGYYDRPWHRRPWFHRRRRHYRHRSSGSRNRSSRVTSSSGGRKGGGRSGGGRSGGGGRGGQS